MASLLATLNALDLRKKIILAAAAIATVALVLYVARAATEPNMALLYGGLDSKTSGEVVSALEQLGVPTQIRGDQILVPAGERDRARLALAKDGLPAQGQAGYELLDNLSGFGTTSEMFEAAYWRSKEGELARTILSVPGVRSARVHIGASARRPFSRASERSSAAVTVKTNGSPLSETSAYSIRYLVALAVADLDAAQVAVIDAQYGVVLRPGDDAGSPFSDESADRRAARLKAELEDLLSVRVGEGAVRISVTVETTNETETVSESIIDPESQVPTTSETEEITENSVGGPGAVTVASNLPDGDQANANGRQSNREQTRETVAFEYSKTQRSKVIEAGAIKRLGVAVLVDEVTSVDADGAVTSAPREPEELAAIEDLVKSAVAFNADRGDVVTVESMRFTAPPGVGVEAEDGAFDRFLSENLMSVIQLAILGAVAVALGLFVVRPILTAAAEPALPQPDGSFGALADGREGDGSVGALEGSADGAATPALGSIGDEGGLAVSSVAADGEAASAAGPALTGTAAALAAAAADGDPAAEAVSKSTVELLRDAVGSKSEESVALLKRWLHMPPEPAVGGAK